MELLLASAALLIFCVIRWHQLREQRLQRHQRRTSRTNLDVRHSQPGQPLGRALDAASWPARDYLDDLADLRREDPAGYAAETDKPKDQLAARAGGSRQCTVCGWYSPDVRPRENGEDCCDSCDTVPF